MRTALVPDLPGFSASKKKKMTDELYSTLFFRRDGKIASNKYNLFIATYDTPSPEIGCIIPELH
jgi:hypothetical protein